MYRPCIYLSYISIDWARSVESKYFLTFGRKWSGLEDIPEVIPEVIFRVIFLQFFWNIS